MTNEHIYTVLKKGLKKGKEKGFKFLMYSSIYFIISTTDSFTDDLIYNISKMYNKHTRHKRYVDIVVNGNLMSVDFDDNGISKELYIHKTREHFSTSFMQKFVNEDDIIIDIGANIGYYVLLESVLLESMVNGKIYAIEPIPSNIDALRKNIQLNNSKNVSVFQYAIGDKEEMSKMYIYDKCNWCSFTKNPDGIIVGELDISTVMLDTFAERYNVCPTFIRMDVEGYEYEIIKGASKILEKNKPLKLFIEFHPHLMTREKFKELLDIMKYNKFDITAVFLETEPFNYRNIGFLNRLRKSMGLPEFGFHGNNYEDIERLAEHMCSPSVFLERKS